MGGHKRLRAFGGPEGIGITSYFFFWRSGTTVLTVGFTAFAEIGLAGDLSFFGFLTSLLLR